MELQYKGSGPLFLRNVFLYVVVSAPVLSLCLMGPAWVRVYLAMVVLALLLLPLAALLVSRMEGFSFDDRNQAFMKRLNRVIPYAGISRVDVNETSGLAQVILVRGRFRSTALISTLSGKDRPRLVEELRKRLPGVTIRERYHRDWKSLLLICTAMIVVTTGFHIVLHARHPSVGVQLQKKDWVQTGEVIRGNAREHRIGEYAFFLPPQYRLLGREETVLFFEDDTKERTEIKVLLIDPSTALDAKRRILTLLTGMGDYADVLEKAFSARFGIVPLVLKDFALFGLDDIRLFSVRQGELNGVITQGAKKGKDTTHILLTGDKLRSEIHMFISGPRRFDERELRELVSPIRLQPEQAGFTGEK